MRTYISPIGYDTRRVTKPVVSNGFSDGDRIVLLRPGGESDTERARQTIADVEQFLHQLEPNLELEVERMTTEPFGKTVRECCDVLAAVEPEHETIVSLGGGARDILLPLTVAALVYGRLVDTVLFYSDLDSTVRELSWPNLTATVPNRATETLDAIIQHGDWITLTEIATQTDQSKSTVIRHVAALESEGLVAADTSDRAKQVRVTFTGELLALAQEQKEQ